RLQGYLQACAGIARQLPESAPPSPVALLGLPGVVTLVVPDGQARAAAAVALFDTALESLVASRAREGAVLVRLIAERIDGLEEEAARVRTALPALLAAQRDRLRERVAELAVAIDHNRFEEELVYLAQRADIDEELDRLAVH